MPDNPGIGQSAKRRFEQPPDARSCFTDFVQVAGTTDGVIVQFYESIPGVPDERGAVNEVRTSLRFTVMMTREHATKIARILAASGAKEQATTP